MTLQYSTALRNNQMAQIQATRGSSATLLFYSGSVPANCAAAATGTLLGTITLPATSMGTPSAGAVSLAGTWAGTASGTGTAGYFRVLDGSSVCHEQGTAGTSGTDMILSSTSFTSGQAFSISTYTVTAGNP